MNSRQGLHQINTEEPTQPWDFLSRALHVATGVLIGLATCAGLILFGKF